MECLPLICVTVLAQKLIDTVEQVLSNLRNTGGVKGLVLGDINAEVSIQ